jgi:hypothetical protein
MVKEISSMLYRLPAASSPEFVEQFEDSWGGVLLTRSTFLFHPTVQFHHLTF